MLPQRLELGTRRHMSQAQWATSLEMHWDGTLYTLEPPAAAIALGQGAEGSGTPAGASTSRKMHLRETAVFDQIVGFLRSAPAACMPKWSLQAVGSGSAAGGWRELPVRDG